MGRRRRRTTANRIDVNSDLAEQQARVRYAFSLQRSRRRLDSPLLSRRKRASLCTSTVGTVRRRTTRLLAFRTDICRVGSCAFVNFQTSAGSRRDSHSQSDKSMSPKLPVTAGRRGQTREYPALAVDSLMAGLKRAVDASAQMITCGAPIEMPVSARAAVVT